MYQVLYRKYRPKLFADVVGQSQVTTTLKNELKSGRIAHAYLFTGSRGTGKTTCAKILAKAVNCLNPQDGDACQVCEVCKGIDEGSILDVAEIDAASNNGVDSIRSLIDETNFTPAYTKYRVYIIDEVHMLSTQAFNAFLKTLEEPPPHVIFILATTEAHRLLPTILSRCQRFDFKRITPEAIVGRVEEVTKLEGSEINRDAALLIARIADGALRDALNLLDQCIGARSLITLADVETAAGITGGAHLFDLAEALIQSDSGAAIEKIDELYQASKDMVRLCEEICEYFRSLMLIKTMKKPEEILVMNHDEAPRLRAQADQLPLPTILHCLDTFERTASRMRQSHPRAELEMAFIRLASSPDANVSLDALVGRIESLEARLRSVNIVSTPPSPSNTRSTTPVATKAQAQADIAEPLKESNDTSQLSEAKRVAGDIHELSDIAKPFPDWPDILDAIKIKSPSIGAALKNSSAYISDNYLLIDAPQIAFDLLKLQAQRDKMREAIMMKTGRTYKLGPYRPSTPTTEKNGANHDALHAIAEKAKAAGIQVQEIDAQENK